MTNPNKHSINPSRDNISSPSSLQGLNNWYLNRERMPATCPLLSLNKKAPSLSNTSNSPNRSPRSNKMTSSGGYRSSLILPWLRVQLCLPIGSCLIRMGVGLTSFCWYGTGSAIGTTSMTVSVWGCMSNSPRSRHLRLPRPRSWS